MSEWHGTGEEDGRITLSPYTKADFKEYLRVNGPVEIKICAVLPESNKMRRWYEGGLIPLIAYYQDGMDHNSSEDRRQVREWLKVEFNGEMIEVAGKAQLIARSTKGRAVFNPFVERVQDWFIQNYDPPTEAMDPVKWTHWHDTVFPYGGPSTYIDYLISTGILQAKNTQ
jgi:hypothetical protein